MFRKLIVGVDGRQGGHDAVALARSLAAPEAEIVLLHAYPGDVGLSRVSLDQYGELLEKEALALLEKEECDARCERRAVADVSPARALHRAAEREGADLLVIGTAHRGPAGRVIAGDVCRGALHGAPCPVAVASVGTSEHAKLVRSVGVGVDPGAPARAALDFAVALATEKQATLRLLTAINAPVAFAPSYAYTYDWSGLLEEDRKAARELLEGMAAGIEAPVVVDVATGNAGEQLVELSKGVDLLVVGSRGWGAFKRVVLGSTADHVVHHASCPVIVVPAPAD